MKYKYTDVDKSGDPLRESWWVEYMESELSEELEKDLDLLLANSEIDQDILDNLENLKGFIKQTDTVELPENNDFYDQLHDKIMDGVENTHMEAPIVAKASRLRRTVASLTPYAVAAMAFFVIAIQAPLKTSSPHNDYVWSKVIEANQEIRTASRHEMAEMVVAQNQTQDFYLDMLSEQLGDLPQAQMQEIIHEALSQ